MPEKDRTATQLVTTATLPLQGRIFMLCVKGQTAGVCTGTIHNLYLEQRQNFIGLADAVLKIDAIMDNLDNPQATTQHRDFTKKPAKRTYRRKAQQQVDERTWSKRGQQLVQQFWPLESFQSETQAEKDGAVVFYVLVRFRQHSSWQGHVTWRNGKRRIVFRSVLELLHLVQSALESRQAEQPLCAAQR